MEHLLTNLVPEERRRAQRRSYYLRLLTVAAILGTGLVIAALALLVPTYVFLASNEHAKEARLATMNSTLSSADEQQLSDRLGALTADAAALTSLQDARSAAATMRDTLAITRPGITLSAFQYAPAGDGKNGTLSLTGLAATRDALRNYQLALQSAPFSLQADLPVSSYAKDSNIPFTITVTLKP